MPGRKFSMWVGRWPSVTRPQLLMLTGEWKWLWTRMPTWLLLELHSHAASYRKNIATSCQKVSISQERLCYDFFFFSYKKSKYSFKLRWTFVMRSNVCLKDQRFTQEGRQSLKTVSLFLLPASLRRDSFLAFCNTDLGLGGEGEVLDWASFCGQIHLCHSLSKIVTMQQLPL